jgi:hypothetical protein
MSKSSLENSNRIITLKTAILLGVAGIIGSLVLFAGDMLLYYNGESTDFIANMSGSSAERIIASGICALIATWFYMLGAGQIYYAFLPEKRWIRLMVFLTFSLIMIAYGIVHGEYIAIATSAKNGVKTGLAPNALIGLAITVNDMLRKITYIPFGIFTILFIKSVWMKKTFYPRWIILFSPIVFFLLMGPIVGLLKGKWKVIIGGGYMNLILFVFFLVTTVSLLKKR